MPGQLFVFLQFEFPWALGPADGRYLLRDGPDAQPEHVVVIESLGAPRRAGEVGGPTGWMARRGARRESELEPEPEPAAITITRVTVIDPVPLSAEPQAKAWLEDLDRDRDVAAALAVVNGVIHAHRVAAADAYAREVSAPQAIAIRAGWGEGEQVASGLWLHARELARITRGRRGDRSWALRPQERLAALLGGRNDELLCEELALRARLDLDQGRVAHAAISLDRAVAAAAGELTAEGRQDLALRISELEQLGDGVAQQAALALRPAHDSRGRPQLDEDLLAHALGRLEATLRARTAPGV